jgi:hypothetical protein
MTKLSIVLAAWLTIAAVPVANADEAAALECAASLKPQARLVFDAVMDNPGPTEPLRRVLASRVSELVLKGSLPLSAARPAATAASECLRIARDCTAEIC